MAKEALHTSIITASGHAFSSNARPSLRASSRAASLRLEANGRSSGISSNLMRHGHHYASAAAPSCAACFRRLRRSPAAGLFFISKCIPGQTRKILWHYGITSRYARQVCGPLFKAMRREIKVEGHGDACSKCLGGVEGVVWERGPRHEQPTPCSTPCRSAAFFRQPSNMVASLCSMRTCTWAGVTFKRTQEQKRKPAMAEHAGSRRLALILARHIVS